MCRSRVARGHFTLMAAGPIEMTAALHDLKVRRQRIIFQWWRRGIGGIKWCLSSTGADRPAPPPPLNYCRTAKMESTSHQTTITTIITRGTPWKQIALLRSFLRPYIIMRNSAIENSEALFVKPNNTSHPAPSAQHHSIMPSLQVTELPLCTRGPFRIFISLY